MIFDNISYDKYPLSLSGHKLTAIYENTLTSNSLSFTTNNEQLL